MRYFWLIFALPSFLFAQDLEFELDPDAFPVEIEGWQPMQPWAGGMEDSTPELCDIDADGDLDFFAGDERGYINYYENQGTVNVPTFRLVCNIFDSLTTPNISWRKVDVILSDSDSDGDADALIGGSYVSYYENTGSTSNPCFTLIQDILYDVDLDYIVGTHIELVDINSDGDLDLFAGHYSGNIRYYENVGNDTSFIFDLIAESWFSINVIGGYADPCFGDLDNDGDLDLLVGTRVGNIYYYLNEGDSLNPQMSLVTGNFFGIDVDWDASPELADIDNDGDLDLFVGRGHATSVSGQGNISFYENIGNPEEANFIHRTDNYLLYDDGWQSRPLLLDIDYDGDPDLFSRLNDELIFFRNNGTLGDPYYVFETDFYEEISIFDIMPWFCDIDQDGDYDLLAGESAIPGPPDMHLFINRGTPQDPDFYHYSDDLLPGSFTQFSVILNPSMVDIDADGDEDLFVCTNEALFYFFENISAPPHIQFQLISTNWQNVADPYGSHRPACFYDIDNDNDYDLFIYKENYGWYPWDKNLMFYRNHGDSINADMQLENEDLFPELMISQAAPFLIDMDQDGDGDLFVGDTWGGIRYFKNTLNDTSSVPPPYQKCPYPCIHIGLGPNPANPTTWITFNLPYPQKATLAVYNLFGQKVATLAQGLQPPGVRTLYWDSSPFSSGVYLIEMETEMGSTVERLTVLK